ncbi:MAG: hypothetical protein IJ007_08005 [Oscillospiraceae bacterium]|nr:hypothetical protein [Oscillospiraceae bacterium]
MKRLKSVFCIAAAVLLSGCFGGREVNKRSFVQIIAVERNDEIYSVGLQLFKSESSDGNPDISKANSASVSGRGITVSEALADAELKAGEELFIGHTKLLVLGDGLKDPSDEIEALYGENLSPSCPVVYSRVPSEITDTMLTEGIFSAEKIISTMETYVNSGKCVYTAAAEISEAAGVTDSAFPLPAVYSDGKELYFSGAVLGNSQGIHGSIPESDMNGMVILSDSFPKDGRINISSEINGVTAAAEIVEAKCVKKASNDGGRLVIDAEIRLKIRVNDNGHKTDEKRIGNAVCENIKDAVISAFSTAVWYNGCDIFGIGKLVRRDCSEMAEAVADPESGVLKDSVLNVSVYGESV